MARQPKVDISLRVVKTEFDRGLKEAREELKRARDEFRWDAEQYKHHDDDSSILKKAVEHNQSLLNIQKESLVQAQAEYQKVVNADRGDTKTAQQMAGRLERERHEYNKLANAVYEAQVAHDAYHSTIGTFGRSLETVGGKIQSAGQNLSSFAQNMMPMALGIGAFGKQSVDAFKDFESTLIGVQKTTNASSAEMQVYGEEVRKVAKELPHTAAEINRVGEIGGQLGIGMDNLLDFSLVMLDLSKTTNLTLEEGATKAAQFANIMSMPEEQYRNFGSAIVDLGNNFATTENDIMHLAHRIGGAGAQLNMTTGDVLGLATALSQTGVKAESGGTNLSKTLIQMKLAVDLGAEGFNDFDSVLQQYGLTVEEVRGAQEEGAQAMEDLASSVGLSVDELDAITSSLDGHAAKLEEWAAASGKSVEQFRKDFQENAAEAFVDLIKNISELDENGQSVAVTLDKLKISGQRQYDTISRLVESHGKLGEAVEMGNRAFEENTALTDEAALRYGSFESQLQVLKNRFNDVLIDIGQRIAPHLLEAVDYVGELIQKWDELSEEQQDFIIKAGGLVALGTPILFTVGRITTGVGGLIKGLGGGLGTLSTFLAKMKNGAPDTIAVSEGVKKLGENALGLKVPLTKATGLAGGLKAALGFVLSPAGVAVAGAAVVGIAAVKKATEDTIKEVDILEDRLVGLDGKGFDPLNKAEMGSVNFERISEETKAVFGEYLKLRDDFNQELIKLSNQNRFTTMTPESSQAFLTALTNEKTYLIQNLDERKSAVLAYQQENNEATSAYYTFQEENLVESLSRVYEREKQETQAKYDEINAIVARSLEEERTLTEEEKTRILEIRQELDQLAIDSMSTFEEDKVIIRDRMHELEQRQTAEAMGEVIRISNEAYAQEIASAQEKYDLLIVEAERLRQAGKITEDEYAQMVNTARISKDEQVHAANETMIGILKEFQEKYPDLVEGMDLTTGELKQSWETFVDNVATQFGLHEGDIRMLIKAYEEQRNEATGNLYQTERAAERHRDNMSTSFEGVMHPIHGAKEAIREYNAMKIQNKYATIRISQIQSVVRDKGWIGTSYASGIDYVPYSGVIAQLHEGERVLTKAENEVYSKTTAESIASLVDKFKTSLEELGSQRANAQARGTMEQTNVINVNLGGVEVKKDTDIDSLGWRIGREIKKELAF